jgi:chemotaxis response regulator CheB
MIPVANAPIKVALIEDSVVALEILERLLNTSPEIEVVGTAQNGQEGINLINRAQPDVICTDLQMPVMDGLEFTKEVMKSCPRPILVVSNAVHPTDIDNIYGLMQAGALDFFPKPTTGAPTDYEKLKSTLVAKIKVLASKKV